MREELLAQLRAAHEAVFDGLLAATDGLDEAGWATPTGCPGWDVHDQLAHCVGVERMMLGEPPTEVEVPELAHLRSPMQRVIERDVHVRRGVPGEDLRAEARATFDRRLDALQQMQPADLDDELDSPIGRMRAAKVLRTRTFDLVSHEHDIRRALDRPGDLDGPHGDIAVGQVLRAWAAALPARIGSPCVLVLDVAGRGAVTLDLGAGELHDGARDGADAHLRLTPGQVLALGGGRTDAPTAEELDRDGDPAVVAAFLAVAGITP